MILAIDVGNTHIVVGCLDRDKIYSISRMTTSLYKTVDEYAVDLKNIRDFNDISYRELDGAIISTVVPPMLKVMRYTVKRLIGKEPLVVGAGIKTGMNILIDNPAQLCSDMVATGVAAIAKYELPVIIFDMGTATTISVIDERANYLGGAIYPGVALSMDALSSGTSQLPKIMLEAPKRSISTNTIECMQSGAIFGTASMVDGMIDRFEAELGKKAACVATGGHANVIIPHCRRDITVDQDLLMQGLGIIYYRNIK
jgi:type III pantothenate kinase